MYRLYFDSSAYGTSQLPFSIVIPVVVGSSPISHPSFRPRFAVRPVGASSIVYRRHAPPRQTPVDRTRPPARVARANMHAMASAEPARFTVATYNIHKGFSQLTRRMVIHELRERLHGLAADILFLQEVLHTNDRHATRYRDWPRRPQHEFIADAFWHEVAYGAQRRVSARPSRQRGAVALPDADAGEPRHLRAPVRKPRPAALRDRRSASGTPSLHCINVHLGLFERGRQWQIRALVERIRAEVPDDAPLIIAGDFNDWRSKGDRALTEALGCVEVFEHVTRASGAHVSVADAGVPARPHLRARPARSSTRACTTRRRGARMSDHAALAATFEVHLAKRRALIVNGRQSRDEPLHRGEFA